MIKKCLPILIAAYILACPLLCKAGRICCGAHIRQGKSHACCEECRTPPACPAENDSIPCNQTPVSPYECGGCICGGAVFEASVFQHLVLDGPNWIAIPTVDQGLAVVGDVEQTTASWAIMPDDGMNLGRAMRCLMMSYLC